MPRGQRSVAHPGLLLDVDTARSRVRLKTARMSMLWPDYSGPTQLSPGADRTPTACVSGNPRLYGTSKPERTFPATTAYMASTRPAFPSGRWRLAMPRRHLPLPNAGRLEAIYAAVAGNVRTGCDTPKNIGLPMTHAVGLRTAHGQTSAGPE